MPRFDTRHYYGCRDADDAADAADITPCHAFRFCFTYATLILIIYFSFFAAVFDAFAAASYLIAAMPPFSRRALIAAALFSLRRLRRCALFSSFSDADV